MIKILLSCPSIDINAIMILNKKFFYLNYGHIKTPICSFAVQKGSLEVIHLLLSHPKIDINQITSCSFNRESGYGIVLFNFKFSYEILNYL